MYSPGNGFHSTIAKQLTWDKTCNFPLMEMHANDLTHKKYIAFKITSNKRQLLTLHISLLLNLLDLYVSNAWPTFPDLFRRSFTFLTRILEAVVSYRVGQTQLGSFWSLITNQSNNTRENGKVPFVFDRWQLQRSGGIAPLSTSRYGQFTPGNEKPVPIW
jgi:hypothetical protein